MNTKKIMNKRPPDPIADLSETIELLMSLTQKTESQVSQLNEIAAKLENQARLLEEKIGSFFSVQTTQLQRVDEAAVLFEHALEEMRNQGSRMLDDLTEQFARRRHDFERIHEEQLKSVNGELNKMLSVATREHEEHHKILEEANQSLRDSTSMLVDQCTADFAKRVEELQSELRSELDQISAEVRLQLEKSIVMWKDTQSTEQVVKAVASSTLETLETLKQEIIIEVRRPWWSRLKVE
jgi:predicted RNA-binding Zn ribbon-like protein